MEAFSFPAQPRALVLDTDAEAGAALVAALDGLGLQAHFASRPNAASALLQVADQEQAPFKLLIISRMVGGICGLNLGCAMRARLVVPPVFFISSGPFGAPESNELERAHCRGVILRPLDKDQFRAVVNEAVPALAQPVAPGTNPHGRVAL